MTYNILAEGLVGSYPNSITGSPCAIQFYSCGGLHGCCPFTCFSHICVSAAARSQLDQHVLALWLSLSMMCNLNSMLLCMAGNCTWGAFVSAGSHMVPEMELPVARLAG